MAFQANAAPAPTNDSWKAQGFINIYLPNKDPAKPRKKLGAIALKDSKPAEKALRAWLEEDPANVAKVLAKMQVEYQSATPADGAGFDLD